MPCNCLSLALFLILPIWIWEKVKLPGFFTEMNFIKDFIDHKNYFVFSIQFFNITDFKLKWRIAHVLLFGLVIRKCFLKAFLKLIFEFLNDAIKVVVCIYNLVDCRCTVKRRMHLFCIKKTQSFTVSKLKFDIRI